LQSKTGGQREFTTKSTKDTKNGIRFKRTSAIGQVQKRKKIVVSLNEAHSPKLNVADKLLTLQKNRLLGSVGSLPPTLRLSSEPFVLFVSFVVK
jgi:hypothetical protein